MKLTPAQFIVAKALAGAYNHLWAGVPDGTYDLEEICKWSDENGSDSFPGISCPEIYETSLGSGFNQVIHTTGSGRLRWYIGELGNIRLHVYRPADLSPAHAATARSIGYAGIQPIQPPEDCGVLVAAIDIINGPEGGERDTFSIGDIAIGSTSYEKTHDEDGQIPAEWIYFGPDDELRDDLLFERHAHALVRPLVALLTIGECEPDLGEPPVHMTDQEINSWWEESQKKRQEWRERVIVPAIAQAKAILAPLFEIALPDPEYNPDDERVEHPETFWSRSEVYECTERGRGSDFVLYKVHHHGEVLPVETERAAVHIVLALRGNPNLTMIEAFRAAARSRQYRPDPTSKLY